MVPATIHCDLVAWREAINLAEAVYKDTEGFPRKETFGLAVQMRRAAVSVSSNLAEGAGRNSRREFLQYVGIACGSIAELETHLVIAMRLGYLKPGALSLDKAIHVGKLVRSLRRSLRAAVN